MTYTRCPREKVSQLINQKVNHSIDLDEVKLIFWETPTGKWTKRIYRGIVTEEQLTWLEKGNWKKSGDKTVILFGHHPIYDTTFRSNYKNLSIDPEMDVYSVLKNKKGGMESMFADITIMIRLSESDNWTFVQIGAVLDVPRGKDV